jgi:pimeloyl-ACP methyl ester carboxylesterase
MLEVIDKGSCSESHPVPLLFVHGGWHAAWCWDEHFLDFFAGKGYRAVALSFRGHGGSSPIASINSCSIADYVDDVREVADQLPTPPVVVGHSMGGFVVQKYLESRDAPAAVLVASVPSRGALAAAMRRLKRYPWNTVRALLTGKSLHAVAATPHLCRESLFSTHTPGPQVLQYHARLQEESARAIWLDMMLLNLPRPKKVTTPLLVVGAECDGMFTPSEERATARAYRTEAKFFPEMGHDMMLEPGWQAVAERIDSWLTARGL